MKKRFSIRKGRFLALLVLLMLAFSAQVMAQTKVSGTVKDDQGEILTGVSVLVKGTKVSTTTNQDGNYQITLPAGSNTLAFTYLGYESKEAAVSGNVINVSLKSSVSTLNDVVVIGYGTTTRKDLTGSVGTVNISDLQKAPVKTFDEALAGRVAGVQVTSSEGQPGSSINITIRGNNSVTQSNYPLVVIDGIIFEDPNNLSVNPLNTIDPNDIESISVLKDASSTAIYGARGSNGVIMVTTKRGKEGLPTITYNGWYGLQENTNRVESLSPYEFVKLQNEIDPVRTKSLYFANNKTLESYAGLKGINWEDEVTRVAPMQNHYLNLQGGNKKTKYTASLSYNGQDGILLNSGFSRLQGKFALDQEVSDRLKVGITATYSGVKNYGSPTSTGNFSNEINLLFSVWAFRPLIVNPNLNLLDLANDPEVEQGSNFTFNPVLTVKNELRENSGENLAASGYAEYQITKELKFKTVASLNRGARIVDLFNGSMSRSGIAGNYLVNGSKTYLNSNTFQSYNTLNYAKRLNKDHYFDVMGGFTVESSKSSAFGATAVLLPNESLGLSGLDEGNPLNITSVTSKFTMASFIARANYKLFDRFLFTGSIRADGSSRFLGDNTWAYFPSAAVAWQLNNEKFVKNIRAISNAKLRVSYGATGNNGVGNFAAHPALSFANPDGTYTVNNFPSYTFGGADSKGLMYSSLGNANLKWESTNQADIGLELGFLKQRLTFEVDVYRKTTSDLLLNAPMSPSSGYNRVFKNIGKVQNQGLEISIGGTPIQTKDFTWTSSFNIAFNRNKLLGLTDNQLNMLTAQGWGEDWKNIPGYVAKLNEPIAQFYGLIYEGTYKYEDFDLLGGVYTLKDNVPSNGGSRANVKPGDVKYTDLDGDLQITEADKTVIGNPNPVHIGGFSNNFNYKGFDLGIFLQWSYGNDIINANRIMFESSYKYGYNQYATYKDRWSPENPTSDMPGVAAGRGSSLKAYSTRIIEDGSFLRLKTVSLGYTLPSGWLQKSKVFKSGRVYVAAQNLYTWTKYSGYDPEVSVRNSALTPGFDYSAYPRARTITFGINTTF
ncbi:SusC/RagA family TonB-linked outer membrane protein [Pedobacter sp. SL55]|uniref:SusC/RagA family TonB-linked outer membrane protein n=1 Tax=Pedobacter sp. SL55 TaxID=2995161 RepID=UPI002271FF83|nr:TonB-dependent receptor [Pedobacter sp. SL55]WAC41772.1 TonB-dependent receptor [Pedobacter sp. SL55]